MNGMHACISLKMAPSHNISSNCVNTLSPYVYNLTYSFADQRNEAGMVAISVVMFLLAALFFNLNLFSRLSDVSAILNPTVRTFLSAALSLFLPVMSYLFSEAKREGVAAPGSGELSLRARTILMWMLLVELLRKKVEAILSSVGMQWYSGTIDRVARVVWLGYLVFYNLRSTGKKAIYGTLWVLAAAKLVQRVAINELLKRSFAYGKNAKLLDSYMAHEEVLPPAPPTGIQGSEFLKSCKYAVMREDSVERMAGPKGYKLKLKTAFMTVDAKKMDADTRSTVVTVGDIWSVADGGKDDAKKMDADTRSTVVTVGDIWSVADGEKDGLLQKGPRLRRLCLSFALYKLLRRRFEDLPITAAETSHCRDLIFKGLCKEEEEEAVEVALFQVFYEEIQFLCEYYHSVLPVVLSNPLFFLANYILFPIIVWAFCLLTFILCGNGDVIYALKSIRGDNYIISIGTMKLTGCLLRNITSPVVLFSTIDQGITILLLLTFLYEQVWEFLVIILSNWLMVSLACEYTAKRHRRKSRTLGGLIRRILWVRSKMSQTNLCFKQFSVLGFCLFSSMALPIKAVPKEVKRSIMKCMKAHVEDCHAAPLNNGWSVLQLEKYNRPHQQHHAKQLSWACESESVAEVILIWHIATSLLEMEYPVKKKTMGPHRKVATTLSKYCAYLVALYPELLPDDKDGTERAYKDMVDELKKELGGCWRYHLSLQRTRYERLMEIGAPKAASGGQQEVHHEIGAQQEAASGGQQEVHHEIGAQQEAASGGQQEVHHEIGAQQEAAAATAVQKGAKLGETLIRQAGAGVDARERVWELLADVWTELMVYVAPSSGEVHVKAHREALAHGGEFVTVLWALATHTGITRPAVAPWEAARRRAGDPESGS